MFFRICCNRKGAYQYIHIHRSSEWFVFQYPPPCLCAREWRVVSQWPCSPTGNTPPESLEKWQSHCSEKVNETDFSKGGTEIQNLKICTPLQRKRYFCRKCAFFAGRGAPPAVVACSPRGTLKITEISIIVPMRFESVLESHRLTKMSPGSP